MSKRFCEQCGAAVAVDAGFCGACGARVEGAAAAPVIHAASLPGAPPPAPLPLFQPRSAAQLPVQRGPRASVVLGLLALGLLLLGGVGIWRYGQFGEVATPESPVAAPTSAPGRAPPSAGSSWPGGSAADAVPLEAPDAEVPIGSDSPGSSAGRPLPLHGPAVGEAPTGLPPIPVTDDPVDLDQLQALVIAANARDIDALYAASPGDRGPETRAALAVAIRALAQGLYRHHVVDGHGDAERARSELRQFLSALEHKGLGLSEDAIEEGLAHVAP